jgi:small subunit ribosomal protein S19
VDQSLSKKVKKSGIGTAEAPIKTWARASHIPPEFVGKWFMIHQGKNFVKVFVSEDMVGHRLGEFAPTRTFHGHGRVVKRTMDKT